MIPRFCANVFERMRGRLTALYGSGAADRCLERLAAAIGRYGIGLDNAAPPSDFGPRDIVLITYPDIARSPDEPPLIVLRRLLKERLRGACNTVHLLPFFPWSSDDGFSVIDYRSVDSNLGTWKDIETLGRDFGLMFDLVVNHVSRQSKWFEDYINGILPARHYFIEADPAIDLSAVVRPRTGPLLSPVNTKLAQRHLWTTFSDDQIDLNFANPDVLFEFIDILLLYLSKGVSILRLDAIAYLWKTIGTDCIHRPETHAIVKLLRDFLDMVAPAARLLTETNVPHEDNISYFGQGDEADMVYQFALPPLLLHAVHAGNAEALTRWAAALKPAPKGCAYLNFTASHDGIGVRPLRGLAPDGALETLARRIRKRGGKVSLQRHADGSESPYEFNITYLDALSEPGDPEGDRRRFLTSQAVMLSLQGVPAVYFQSLLGIRNDLDGVERTGIARRINRRKFQIKELCARLEDEKDEVHAIFKAYTRMLRVRSSQPAFAPAAEQAVLRVHRACFALRRRTRQPGGRHQTIVCVSNLSARPLRLKLSGDLACLKQAAQWRELLSDTVWRADGGVLALTPWQTCWLAV